MNKIKLEKEERKILKEFESCDTITRLDVNEFEVVKGKVSYSLYTDLQGTLRKKYPKGLFGNLRKNAKYKIEELLKDENN